MDDNERCWIKLFNSLPENQRRWVAAQKAIEIGYGGITHVSELTSLSRTTITRGIKEINSDEDLMEHRTRDIGGGRKKIETINLKIIPELEQILESDVSGDPMNPLLWVSKSIRNIEECLRKRNVDIGRTAVNRLLQDME